MTVAIPHSRPLLGAEEEAAALRVLRSGRLAQGPEVAALEAEAAAALGTRYAVAVAHGTAALHLGLLGLGAGPGSTVLLPSYACTSLLNAVLLTGAEPVLVDCAPGSADMDLHDAADRVRPDTAAALVPHLFGRPLDVRALERRVPVLTDGTHAPGATVRGRSAARQGHGCAFSFYATKMMAAGEGGLLATDRTALARLARDLRSYDERPEYRLRFNYKMTEVAAAVLRVQLRRLPEFLQRRRAIAGVYRRELGHLLEAPEPMAGEVPYRFPARVPARRLPGLLQALQSAGVGAARPVFRPLHRYLDRSAQEYPHAERAWRQIVSLPLHPSMTEAEVDQVVHAVRRAFA